MLFDNTRIACAASDRYFYTKAFAEYIADKQKKFNELISLYNLALSQEEVLTEETVDSFILSNSSITYTNCYVPFNEGFVPLRQLLLNVSYATDKIAENEPFVPLPTTSVAGGANIPMFMASAQFGSVPGTDEIISAGQYNEYDGIISVLSSVEEVRDVKLSIMEVGSQLQTQLHSITSLLGATLASARDNAAERLSYFREFLSRTFTNAYDDISNSAGYYAQLLDSINSPETFLSTVISDMQITDLAEDGNDINIEDTNIANYTGASPVGPLDFSSTISTIGAIAKTGAKIVSNVVESIFGWVKSGVEKTIDAVYKIVVDPVDLECINKNALSSTISTWNYHGRKAVSPQQFPDLPVAEANVIADSLDANIKLHTIFAEILLTDNEFVVSGDSTSSQISGSTEVQVRLRPVNPHLVYAVFNEIPQPVGGLIKPVDVISALNKLREAESLYLDIDSDERLLACGFLCAEHMNRWLSDCIIDEVRYYDSEEWYEESRLFDPRNYIAKCLPDSEDNPLPATINNLDFVSLASGYRQDTQDFPTIADSRIQYSVQPQDVINGTHVQVGNILAAYIRNRVQRHLYPMSYAFFPFRSAEVKFDDPKFRIKTDADNAAAFNTFMTTAIVVTIVAVVAISSIILVKRLATKLAMKSAGLQRAYENKLANGTATAADYKMMKKAKLRARILNGGAAKLQSVATAASSAPQADLSVISDLITG